MMGNTSVNRRNLWLLLGGSLVGVLLVLLGWIFFPNYFIWFVITGSLIGSGIAGVITKRQQNKKMNETIEVSQKRDFSLHHALLGAARVSLKNSEKKDPGWGYSYLICITMSALALEAIANAFGDKLVPNWKYYESSNPLAKFLTVANKIGIEVDFEVKPWSNVKWLYNLRNKIAHAKPMYIETNTTLSREEFDTNFNLPESSLEKQFTKGNAKKAFETVEEVKHLLCDQIDPYDQFGLRNDGWTGETINTKNG